MKSMNDTLFAYHMQFQNLLHRYHGASTLKGKAFANPYRGQGRVLAILKMQPEITQKELGYLLDMRNQSLGELLTKLEAKEYITRSPSDEDKRTMMVKLTQIGEDAIYMMDHDAQGDESIFSILSEEEKQQYMHILQSLIATLEQRLADVGIHNMMFDRRSGGDFFRGFEHNMDAHQFHELKKERKAMMQAMRRDRRQNKRGVQSDDESIDPFTE